MNALDQLQMQEIAGRRLGKGSPAYAEFVSELGRRRDVRLVAGTPLTAMLMVFFFEAEGRFSRRYDVYRLLVLFVVMGA